MQSGQANPMGGASRAAPIGDGNLPPRREYEFEYES